VKIAGLFIEGGTVLKLADRKAGATELRAGAGGPAWKGPLAAIVNGGTAGAAEALAAALRDRAGASLIGEKTWGLGTSQKVIPLPAGDGIRLSVGKWQSPTGKEWNGTGLTPDIVQQPGPGDGKEDLQIQKTLEILKKGPGNRQAA
jgi:carboxyl-terminal processing protease